MNETESFNTCEYGPKTFFNVSKMLKTFCKTCYMCVTFWLVLTHPSPHLYAHSWLNSTKLNLVNKQVLTMAPQRNCSDNCFDIFHMICS